MIVQRRHGPFIATTEHRQFVEFAKAVRQTDISGCALAPPVSARRSQRDATPTGNARTLGR